jgi:hypothetical protein
LQNTCSNVVCWQVDATNTKEQANAKHQKKPKEKHKREKANFQSTLIKCIIMNCVKA